MSNMNDEEDEKRIVVCIKPIKIDKKNSSKGYEYDISPYDFYALFQALQYKKTHKTQIICIAMGPKDSCKALEKCVALGADEAILLNDSGFIGADTFSTSYTLSKAIAMLYPINCILAGRKSLDGETGYVGVEISEWLDIPLIMELSEEFRLNHIIDDYHEIPCVVVFSHYKDRPAFGLFELKKIKNARVQNLCSEQIKANLNLCGFKGAMTVVNDIIPIDMKRESSMSCCAVDEICTIIMDKI